MWEVARPLLLETAAEVVAVGRGLGFSESDFPSTAAEDTAAWNRMAFTDPNSKHQPSTVLDIEAGKPFEVEVIVGEVVRAGKRLSIRIPR